MSRFVLVQGRYDVDGPCPACGGRLWSCPPGEYPKCEECGVKVLRFGRVPAADCVSGSGRVDQHFGIMRRTKSGRFVCGFCGKP